MAGAGACVYLEQLITHGEGTEQRAGAGCDLVIGLRRVEHLWTEQQRRHVALVPFPNLKIQGLCAGVGNDERLCHSPGRCHGLFHRGRRDLDLRCVQHQRYIMGRCLLGNDCHDLCIGLIPLSGDDDGIVTCLQPPGTVGICGVRNDAGRARDDVNQCPFQRPAWSVARHRAQQFAPVVRRAHGHGHRDVYPAVVEIVAGDLELGGVLTRLIHCPGVKHHVHILRVVHGHCVADRILAQPGHLGARRQSSVDLGRWIAKVVKDFKSYLLITPRISP